MLNLRQLLRPSVLGLAAMFAFGVQPTDLAAQENFGTVVGAITAGDTGQPLASTNVLIEGTGLGSLTNAQGRFTIRNVPPGTYVLQVNSIGYETTTVDFTVLAGETAVVNATLALDPLSLDEIVVTGYGTARKEELTGSIVSISSTQLELPTTTTFQDVIQGSPGVLVTSLDGAPGAGFDIRVRGQGSITAGAEPLYVVDGVPMFNNQSANTEIGNGGRTGNTMASFNPNDIESIVVLKDAASTAIYGSRGANGVVLITTKGGVAGSPIWSSEPQFTLRSQLGVSNWAHGNLHEGLNAEQYRDYYITARMNDGMSLADAQAQLQNQWPISDGVDNNWRDLISRNGITNQLDLSATGGSDRFTYFLSAGRFDQEGNVDQQFFTRWSSRANLTARLTDNFTLSNNLSISYTQQNGINDGSAWEAPFYMAVFMPPLLPMYDEDGFWYHRHTNVMGANHPVGGLYENPKERETQRIVENVSGTYRFNENFTASSSFSVDLYNIHDYVYQNPFFGDGRNIGGFVDDSRVDAMNWQSTSTVTYDNLFSGIHSVNAVVGYEAAKNDRERTNSWGQGFAHPDLKQVTSAAIPNGTSTKSQYAFESYFGRVNYDFDRTYYLSGSYRSDGSSRFGPDQRWGDFWSVGAGVTLTEMTEDLPLFDYLKLRGSYGQVGNAEIGNYAWQGLYGFARDYDGLPGASPTGVANTALTWESQGSFNIGFDYAMFDNRISGSVEYYQKTSTDLLLNVPTSLTTGFRSTLQNFGDMENSGIEFSLAADVVRAQDFDFSLNFNVTTQSNEITRLQEPILAGTKRREQGRDYQEYYLYGWAGVNPENGDPLYYTDETKTATTSSLSEAERFYDGKSATPDILGSFGFQGRYKSFSVSTLATYMFGHHLFESAARFYEGDGRYLPRSTSLYLYENAWRQPGDNAVYPRFSWGGVNSSQPSNSSRWLFKGDYIRFKDVTLSYQFPESVASMVRLSSLQAQLNVTNAWTWVADENLRFDPEQIVSGVYNTGTPNARTFSFGFTMGF